MRGKSAVFADVSGSGQRRDVSLDRRVASGTELSSSRTTGERDHARTSRNTSGDTREHVSTDDAAETLKFRFSSSHAPIIASLCMVVKR